MIIVIHVVNYILLNFNVIRALWHCAVAGSILGEDLWKKKKNLHAPYRGQGFFFTMEVTSYFICGPAKL